MRFQVENRIFLEKGKLLRKKRPLLKNTWFSIFLGGGHEIPQIVECVRSSLFFFPEKKK